MVKLEGKLKAVDLRRKGLSYSAILKEVPVAKSTLSLWLRDVGLSKRQTVRLTEKRILAARRGGLARKLDRIRRTEQVQKIAVSELGHIDKKAFLLAGAALYWAEGSKQKDHNVSALVIFANSDPEMIKFFYNWLIKICLIKSEDIHFELYIHENADIARSKRFWAESLKLDMGYFNKVRLKKNISNSFRKNKGSSYNGVIRINVRRSSNFNRRISGWVFGLCEQFYKYSGVV